MRISELGERITLQTATRAPAAATGGMTESFETLFVAWANVKVERGGRFQDGEQIDDAATHSFLIRHRAGWRDARFIEWGGRRWRVTAAAEVTPRRWVSLKAVEEGAADGG